MFNYNNQYTYTYVMVAGVAKTRFLIFVIGSNLVTNKYVSLNGILSIAVADKRINTSE